MAHLNCDELINCLEIYYFNRKVFIILEYMDQGALTDFVLRNQKNYSEDSVKYCLYKVAKGLDSLHSRNVLHRDIKSDNILYSADGQIKICDLGFSTFLSEQEKSRKTQAGTPNWASPEVIKGVPYAKEVDVWSFGCFAYELATGHPPFI